MFRVSCVTPNVIFYNTPLIGTPWTFRFISYVLGGVRIDPHHRTNAGHQAIDPELNPFVSLQFAALKPFEFTNAGN